MIDPRGLTLRDWADSTILDLNNAWSFSRLDDEEHWQSWGTELLRALPFSQQVAPDPYQFSDWRVWAERMAPILEGAT